MAKYGVCCKVYKDMIYMTEEAFKKFNSGEEVLVSNSWTPHVHLAVKFPTMKKAEDAMMLIPSSHMCATGLPKVCRF